MRASGFRTEPGVFALSRLSRTRELAAARPARLLPPLPGITSRTGRDFTASAKSWSEGRAVFPGREPPGRDGSEPGDFAR